MGSCGSPTTIKHHIVKPEHLQKISKFRSCCGHSYGSESKRSMKHYLHPLQSFGPSNDQLPVYAPFDGNFDGAEYEQQVLYCYNDGIPHGKLMNIRSFENPNFTIRLFHVRPVVSTGRIRAGEIIAYADLRGCDHQNPNVQLTTPSSFDITTEGGGIIEGDNFSMFEHMDPSLLADWAQFGITPDNVVVSKESRDADPCTNFDGQMCSNDEICLAGQTCTQE